ncbi:MAG: RNA polymerase subunit sigma [Fluviicola sp.]|nr:MAG: RNA polymerase subunit sigma [Fluviicola sp.]
MKETQLIPNLFRSEFSKIVSVLCKSFGIGNIQLAEDIASDTFLIASETWSLKGIPENPKAWLYSVAKNKTKDYFKRNSIYDEKIVPELKRENVDHQIEELDLSSENIEDSQLKMLFTICNPLLSKEAQISLALRVLCGLGIDEIASALLTNKSTINKRLQRAKTTYRKHKIELSLPSKEELAERQHSVLTIIYLLFNEGYYSSTTEKNTKKHLCLEAMSLLLIFIRSNNIPEADALMALFCFHSSRFEAREDELGNSILYEDQDTELWSQELISKGEEYLQKSVSGNAISKYHIEASIAFWHTKPAKNKLKWESILHLYNHLLQIEYSPITALNRTFALSKVNGKEKAISEALKINLNKNHLYHALLAELYHGIDEANEVTHLKIALSLAKTASERDLLKIKLNKTIPHT